MIFIENNVVIGVYDRDDIDASDSFNSILNYLSFIFSLGNYSRNWNQRSITTQNSEHEK